MRSRTHKRKQSHDHRSVKYQNRQASFDQQSVRYVTVVLERSFPTPLIIFKLRPRPAKSAELISNNLCFWHSRQAYL